MTDRPPRFVSRYTADTVARETDGRLVSPSFERNYEPIRDVLARLLAGRQGTVLEIGSGPGQHVAHLARDIPGLRWLPSDPEPSHRESAAAWRAALAPAGLLEPVALDARRDWPADPPVRPHLPLTAVYAQNVAHIAEWAVTEGIVAGAARALDPGGLLVFYGPFAEGGRHTGPGNARFDAALRAQDPAWGVRDVDDVADMADAAGFFAPEVTVMPSDNRILAFARR